MVIVDQMMPRTFISSTRLATACYLRAVRVFPLDRWFSRAETGKPSRSSKIIPIFINNRTKVHGSKPCLEAHWCRYCTPNYSRWSTGMNISATYHEESATSRFPHTAFTLRISIAISPHHHCLAITSSHSHYCAR